MHKYAEVVVVAAISTAKAHIFVLNCYEHLKIKINISYITVETDRVVNSEWATGSTTHGSNPDRAKRFLCSKMSRPALGSTYSTCNGLSSGGKAAGA
jgi:hypothetical protein